MHSSPRTILDLGNNVADDDVIAANHDVVEDDADVVVEGVQTVNGVQPGKGGHQQQQPAPAAASKPAPHRHLAAVAAATAAAAAFIPPKIEQQMILERAKRELEDKKPEQVVPPTAPEPEPVCNYSTETTAL